MKKLFVAVIGGHVPGEHVELHDTRFVIGETIEACYPALKAQWWGTPESLHLDAWGPLEWADGCGISVAEKPDDSRDKLWFFNLGGYDPGLFEELHENLFLVGADWRDAKARALEIAAADWVSPHKDYVFNVDAAIDVAAAAGGHIRLTAGAEEKPFRFEARYVPIGKLKS